MERISKVPSPFQTKMFAKASLNKRDDVCLAELYLVEEVAVLGEAAQFALQVDDARFLPHHLDPQLVVPLLQLPDLLPVFILLNQAVGVLGLSLIPRAERLQGGQETSLVPGHQSLLLLLLFVRCWQWDFRSGTQSPINTAVRTRMSHSSTIKNYDDEGGSFTAPSGMVGKCPRLHMG